MFQRPIESILVIGAWLAAASAFAAQDSNPVSEPALCRGMCDASAAVAIDKDLFAVANDEDNVIRIYRANKSGTPVDAIDLSTFLRVDPKFPETDLEGAAWLGDKIFWIASHGRNHDGKFRASRDRFFATTLAKTNDTVRLVPVGRPYMSLLGDFIRDPRLKPFKLAAASRLPPKHPSGLNIEGLCATPDKRLLIGFRNPIPNGKALIVPLLNPDDVVSGSSAKLGDPVLLNLEGKGVRDIGYWHGKYVIIAGSYDAAGVSEVYLWKGGSAQPQRMRGIDLQKINPEAVVVYPELPIGFQLLSDDGTKLIDGMICKRLPNPIRKQFRSVWVNPP